MAKEIIVENWSTFKDLITLKNPKLQEESENSSHYNLFFQDHISIYGFSVEKGTADETDYLANYRPDVNLPYVQNTVFTGNITSSQSRYSPRFYYSNTNIDVNNNTVLVSLNFNGQVDAVKAVFDTDDDHEFVIEVDNTEILRFIPKDFKKDLELDDGDKIGIFPVYVEDGGKEVYVNWRTPVDVESNFTIKANRLSSDPDMKAILVQYRELIT